MTAVLAGAVRWVGRLLREWVESRAKVALDVIAILLVLAGVWTWMVGPVVDEQWRHAEAAAASVKDSVTPDAGWLKGWFKGDAR